MSRNSGISIYGVANKVIHRKAFSFQQRKRIRYINKKGRQISYLRRTGKTIHVKAHVRKTKGRETRFSFWGSPEQCKMAQDKMEKEGLVPRSQYADRLNANAFLRNPNKYGIKGEWQKQETKKS